MLLACTLGLLLTAAPAAAPAPADAERHSLELAPDSKEARSRHAAREFAARRYPQAARAYEALFADFDEPGFLLGAGRSRLAAGHRAHAVAYLSQLLASGLLTATDTQVAYGELEAAQRAVTPVTLRLALPADLDHTPKVFAEHVSPTGAEPRPVLEFPLPNGASAERVLLLQLDPDTWRLRINDPALVPLDMQIHVRVQPGDALQLDLRPRGPGTGLARPRLQRQVIVLGGLGGAALGAGIGVTIAGDRRLRSTLARPACLDRLPCQQDLADAATLRSFGAALLGAGAGVAIAGLTGLTQNPQLRRRLWLIELALGGASIFGGSVALARTTRGFNNANIAPSGDEAELLARVERRAAQHTLAATMLGLGSGLTLAAVGALLHTRIAGRRQLQPALGLGPAGPALAVSGRF